jgi:methionyl-tRNA formyltransferase
MTLESAKMSAPPTGLRVVTFNFLPAAYQMVARWAEQMGHQILLVVTSQGPSTRPTPSFREVVAMAAANRHDTLVTTRLRRIAAPLIAALQPDIVVSMTFPYRIPPEITSVPRFGAVNLHPAPLPKGRGPNPLRLIYDGDPTIGATLHRTDAEFDTGPILSKKEVPLPEVVTPETIFAVWPGLMFSAFAEGVAKAIAGDPGEPQDHSEATYAGQFTEEELWLNWQEPKSVLQRRTTALNLFVPSAQARIDGTPYNIRSVEPVTGAAPDAEPGAMLAQTDDGFLVAVGDGVVRVIAIPADDSGSH